jgi:hypothetical protein
MRWISLLLEPWPTFKPVGTGFVAYENGAQPTTAGISTNFTVSGP